MRTFKPAAAAVAVGALLAAGAPAASASVTCAYNATTGTATVTMKDYDTANVGKGASGAIVVDGAACGAATASNVNTLQVLGDTASQTLELNLALPLGPGRTPEATPAASEIEVNAALGGGTDVLRVIGGDAANTWTFGSSGANLNNDGDGDDLRFSGLDDLQLVSRGGNDVLSLAGSAVTGSPLNKRSELYAGQGADVVTGGPAYDYVYGDADEEYETPATGGADRLSGGRGGDWMVGGPAADTLNGEDDGDELCGGPGNDVLNGGPGDDAFEPDFVSQCEASAPDGADVYNGGTGTRDRIEYYQRTAAVSVTLNGSADDGAAGELDNVRGDIESISGGRGNDTLDASTTGAGNDLEGNDGNDVILAGAERDQVDGGRGDDKIDGGSEDDLVYAGDGLDTVRGGEGDDYLEGGLGKDAVSGEGGDDSLPQGTQVDAGDVLSGGPGSDEVDYGSRASNTRVSLDDVANDGADADQNGAAEEIDNVRSDVEDVSTGSGKDFVNANTTAANTAALDNRLDGGPGQDTLDGGRGEDELLGWEDNDTLTGGPGGDQLHGGGGADRFVALDGDYDYIDAGSGDGVTDTGTFDPFDQRVYFP